MIEDVQRWHGDTIMYPTAVPHPWQHRVCVKHSQVRAGVRSGDMAACMESPDWLDMEARAKFAELAEDEADDAEYE